MIILQAIHDVNREPHVITQQHPQIHVIIQQPTYTLILVA